MAKQTISATIDTTLLSRLDAVADETERKRSWLICKAIESYLEDFMDAQLAKRRLQEPRLTPQQLRKSLRVSR